MPATTVSTSAADLHDPTSAAFKKARRQYLKTTRNRTEHVEAEWTPFRAAEKKFKARFPPPDLSGVLDLALLDDSRAAEVSNGVWKGRPNAVQCEEIELRPRGRSSGIRKAYIFPNTPGLVLLPSFVPPDEQRRLVRWALCDQARHPNATNLDAHYILPEDGLWNRFLQSKKEACEDTLVEPRASSPDPPEVIPSPEPPGPRKLVFNEPAGKHNYVKLSAAPKPPPAPSPSVSPSPVSSLIPKLRWANIGWFYHWGTKHYDFTQGPGVIHDEVREVCKRAVTAVEWEKVFGSERIPRGGWGEDAPDWDSWHEIYEPDAGIVNFYQAKDTLMAHVDRSEVCATSPLVSISLGCAAVFLIGGLTRDVEPIPILLRSGDVVIMSGPTCRRAYHGVPRILEGTLPPHLVAETDNDEWTVYEEYLRTTRINVNVRQVFPRGFNPELHSAAGS
ncbi:hypothetical protein POSPLADRAFT_1044247 [Postia placenta MAD-698-R-SB12]|uniref:Fe2OG dioxygenase domain-containing protein n=1 Tax=Postia placenta MAD-698-R-SB12 TaxID=670580 RepID=A0A1X6N840_9APHY|nr:hypothetical protein POSPLADRAFT_1044247 [Postia placenta MAD-698-R-SB12]OSX64798.1 hypothetical protein POSPLADRAFT_1044247 [Postia placenta MAD-698-R-SB12]